jgi:hypothetical protein
LGYTLLAIPAVASETTIAPTKDTHCNQVEEAAKIIGNGKNQPIQEAAKIIGNGNVAENEVQFAGATSCISKAQ